jgi:type IV secretory pathway protease TraF
MMVGLSDRVRKIRTAALVATGVVFAAFQLSDSLGLRINTSPSLPLGLYIRPIAARISLSSVQRSPSLRWLSSAATATPALAPTARLLY